MKPKYTRVAAFLPSAWTSRNRQVVLSSATACLLGFTTNVHGLDLLNDTLTDNERLTQTLPTSARWFLRTASAVPTPTGLAAGYSAAGGNLDLPYLNPSAAHTQLAYFTASNAPITLANDGDAITVTLKVTMDQIPNSADSIRFGFFNSALVRLSADDNGANVTTQGYKGFISRFNPSTRVGTMQERTSAGGSDQLFGGTLTTETVTSTPAPVLTAGTAFPVTLVVTKVATGIRIDATFNGGTYLSTDTTPATLSFDTFAMFGSSALTQFAAAAGSGLTMDDVVVSVNFTPPAPPADPMKWAIGNGDWNTTSANWVPIAGGAPVNFTNGSEVTFNDDASGTSPIAINLTDVRTPASATVNSTKNYTFSGSAIAGVGFLTKSGTSTLTLAAANTFTGATNLNAGSILVKNQDALATSAVTLGGGTLLFDSTAGGIVSLGGLSAASSGPAFDIVLQDNAGSPAAVQLNVNGGGVYSGILSGPGALLKGGTGSLTLTQANTYSGNTFLEGSGAFKITNPNAFGSGSLFLSSVGSPAGVATLEISGGINFSKAITIDSTTGREQFSSTTGANTLSSPITIDNGGTNGMNFSSDGGVGNPFTVSGAITAPDFAGAFALRGVSGGLFSSPVTAPSAVFEFLQTAANTIWTVNSPGSTWSITRFTMNANGLAGAEVGFPGGKLTLGANDALCTTARVQWNNANNSIAGGTLDLAGFNQTVAGLDKPGVNLVAPTANTTPVITNSGATDSTLTLAALSANRSYSGKINDGATKKVSLVVNAPGFTQSLIGAAGSLTYTGNTTINDGALSVTNPSFADTSTLTIGAAVDSPAVLALPTAGTDTVASLVIDGVTMPAGVYGATGSTLPTIETSAITGLGTITVSAAAAPTTTTLTSNANPANLGATVTFTATVASGAGTPTGTVNFLDGVTNIGSGTLDGSGVATLATSVLAAGSHSITASYAGAGSFAASTSSPLAQVIRTDYEAWAASFVGFTDNAPTADQDKDGLVNQQEYAFGLNPISGSSVSPITGGLATNGSFSYTRRATSGLSYKVYTSTTLGAWTLDAGATQTPGATDGNGVQSVAVTLTAAPVGGKLFVRVAAD